MRADVLGIPTVVILLKVAVVADAERFAFEIIYVTIVLVGLTGR